MRKYTPVNYIPHIGPFEVVVHNQPDDCWVSFLGNVYDLTPLVKQYENERCIKAIIAFAGKDISHWFDERTGEIQHYVHPITGAVVPYCPHGRIPDVGYQVPTTKWVPLEEIAWWKSDKYKVGPLSKRVRPLRIINMLTCYEVYLDVCCEDTLERIMERYSLFSDNCESYTWTFLCRKLEMELTLEENGVPDERDRLVGVGLPQSTYVPALCLYYNDDMKWEEQEEANKLL